MEFTFGIITSKKNPLKELNQIITSIQELQIPNYEIIIIGGEEEVILDRLKIYKFDESQKPGWITKKKNLITQKAKYENIVYSHDYIYFDKDWYVNFLDFGNNFKVCMNQIIDIDGKRYRDWTLCQLVPETKDLIPYLLLPYKFRNLSKLMYFSGAYWVAKKSVMEEFPLDENLLHCQMEDIDWSWKLTKKYNFSINEKSIVRLNKPNYRFFEEPVVNSEIYKKIELMNNSMLYTNHADSDINEFNIKNKLKNKKFIINFIPHKRNQYSFKILRELFNIDSELRKDIYLNIMPTNLNNFDLEKIKQGLIESKIDFDINLKRLYIEKINNGTNLESQFSIKLDEDIFMHKDTWEFFLKNSDLLEDENNLLLSPIITNGIPSVDSFIKQFFDEDSLRDIKQIFKKFEFGKEWGVDYTLLNKHTIYAESWLEESFYESVYKINHPFKGVHPVRFSNEAQAYILGYIISNFKRFITTRPLGISIYKKPYFCNSVFMIKTKVWRDILNNKSLFIDQYDEVPINQYMNNNNLNMLFIDNGFAVHPSYNSLDDRGFSYKHLSDIFFSINYFN
jgi:hypothetical protein